MRILEWKKECTAKNAWQDQVAETQSSVNVRCAVLATSLSSTDQLTSAFLSQTPVHVFRGHSQAEVTLSHEPALQSSSYARVRLFLRGRFGPGIRCMQLYKNSKGEHHHRMTSLVCCRLTVYATP
jgi:hypothetical protein